MTFVATGTSTPGRPRGAAAGTIEQTDTETGTGTGTDTDTVDQRDRPWQVVVWNDPVNLMSYVTFVFRKLFGYSNAKATRLMLDVHHKGRAVVSSGPRERAEHDAYRLHQHGLWATLERSA
jgi:ATP-dependent Clp protease adaptor protein ClpS